jgi:hypothetical protein
MRPAGSVTVFNDGRLGAGSAAGPGHRARMSGNPGPRVRTALHEAGHIVLLHLDGGRTAGCAILADGSAQTQAEFPPPARLSAEQQRWWRAATAYVQGDRHSYADLHGALSGVPLPAGWQAALAPSIAKLLAYLWAGEIAEDMAGGDDDASTGSEAAALDRLKIATLESATRGGLAAGEPAVSERQATAQRLERFRSDIMRLAQALYELGELDQGTIIQLLNAQTASPLSPLGTALATLGLAGLGAVLLDEVPDPFDWFDS